jgi:hypothetical protein
MFDYLSNPRHSRNGHLSGNRFALIMTGFPAKGNANPVARIKAGRGD